MTCRLGEPEGTQVLPDDDNDSDGDVFHGVALMLIPFHCTPAWQKA